MTKFVVQEFDVVVRIQIATYYPICLEEDTTKILNAVTKAVQEAGKDLDFLTGVTTITITKEKANETTNPT